MTFLKSIPSSAIVTDDDLQATYIDDKGMLRIANRVSHQEPHTRSIYCRINGDKYEQLLDENGEILKSKVIQLLPQVQDIFKRVGDKPKIAFTATFVKAIYQHVAHATSDRLTFNLVKVTSSKGATKDFVNSDRKEAMRLALAWMEQFDEATLKVSVEPVKVATKVTQLEDTYKGRKNLSYVEIELSVTSLDTVNEWIVL